LIDESKKIFKVSRRALVDPDILEASGRRYSTMLLYLGIVRLAKPGDSSPVRSEGATLSLLATARGDLKAMLNTARIAATVCREKHGSAKSFQCFYHGWVFGLDGTLRASPARPPTPRISRRVRPPACSSGAVRDYRDLNFICFDKGVESFRTISVR